MPVVNAAKLNAANTGFKTVFNQAFANAPDPDWPKVAMLVNSTTSQEAYPWLGQNSRFREWVGPRVVQNLKLHKYTLVNRTFEDTVGVPGEAIEDDQLGAYGPAIGQLGEDTKGFPDELVFELLADGFSELCYDKQPFFDEDHPVVDPATKKEVSVSNMIAGSSDAWFLLDTSRMVKPLIFQNRRKFKLVQKDKDTDDNKFMDNEIIYGVDGRCAAGFGLWQMGIGCKTALDATSFKEARRMMRAFKGDSGKPLKMRPNLLVVGIGNEDAATEILEAERNANGATNTLKGKAQLLVCDLLD